MPTQSVFIIGNYIIRLSDIDKIWHTTEFGDKQIRMFVGGSPLTLRGDDRIRFIKWLNKNSDVTTDENSWFDEALE